MSRLGRCASVALSGVHGTVVDIEAHLGGMPGFSLVGLPDASLTEARDRVRAAVLSSGVDWPLQRITVSLSPASLPKRGSHFDLGLALAILEASEVVPPDSVRKAVILGELALDGRLHSVPGVLPAVLAAVRAGYTQVLVPEGNAAEAQLVPGATVVGALSLRQVLARLRGEPVPDEPFGTPPAGSEATDGLTADVSQDPPDLADVAGQKAAKRVLEVAAAGHHHLSMIGPPGAGKTMLARRLPGLLPDLDLTESLEVTAIHSVAGLLPADRPMLTRPPFADPHHTASVAAIVGGGGRYLRPGAASRAHRGVLFLDEAPEFASRVLDALRQPLEHGEIVVSRAEATATFPARFQLVLAANPCSCGQHGSRTGTCTCPPAAIRRYEHRVSGPVRDRIDLHASVATPSLAELEDELGRNEPSAAVAERVAEARERQRRRFRDTFWQLNSEVSGRALRTQFRVPPAALVPMSDAVRKGDLSPRGADKVLRLAWTVADLGGRGCPDIDDVAAAVSMRRTEWS